MNDDLTPYRRRRRKHRLGVFLLGYLAGAFLAPAVADLIGQMLDDLNMSEAPERAEEAAQ